MNEDCRAVCQAIYKDVEGAEWERLYCKFVEMSKEVDVTHPSGSSRAKTLWKVRDAKPFSCASWLQQCELHSCPQHFVA